MVGLGLESAKNIGIAVAIGLVVLMVMAAWIIKNVTTKLLTVFVLGGLALLVWSQRSSLEGCAKKIHDRGVVLDSSKLTCSFLGTDVKVPLP